MKSFQRIAINPGNAIFVVVDMENEFCKPGGVAYRPVTERIMPGVISAIRGLLDRVRAAGVPTVYIQSVRTLQEPEITVFGAPTHLVIGTPATDIIEELKPRSQDAVVQKFSHDPFYRTRLDEVLHGLVPDPTRCYAVVTGGAANVCVYHTTLGFHNRGFWTVLVVDGLYYTMDNGKDLAMQMLSGPGYRNVFFTRSELVSVSGHPTSERPPLIPGT